LNSLKETLNLLQPISLKEMDGVKLMNRTDTKFAFNKNLLPEILKECRNDYRVLEIKNERLPSYKTLYFDTEDFNLFLDHHNDRPNRFKVRIRNYVESELFYLEAKLKVNGRTVKSRIKIPGFEHHLHDSTTEFIRDATGKDLPLVPILWNSFKRITLVNNTEKERLTIDVGLEFEANGKKYSLPNLAIAEVKQENFNRYSKIIQVLRSHRIHESGLSKYCIGAVLSFPGIKYNKFKEKILLINRINQAA
jgi:hypothetical protein